MDLNGEINMKRRFSSKLLLLAGVITTSPVLFAATPTGATLGGTCTACHGYNGSSVGIIPSIAGNTVDYFVDSMEAFKSGERKSTVMGRIAKGYSSEEISKMAEFFASKPAQPMTQSFDTAKASLGARIHEESCNKCHKQGGKSGKEDPILAGQSMLYLQYSMADFKNKDREPDEKMAKKVKEVIEKHGTDGLEALIHYYGSHK
jgi:sulfide dehydrogenase cytochrome subunit